MPGLPDMPWTLGHIMRVDREAVVILFSDVQYFQTSLHIFPFCAGGCLFARVPYQPWQLVPGHHVTPDCFRPSLKPIHKPQHVTQLRDPPLSPPCP